MDKFKEKFKNDPVFALTVIAIAVPIAVSALNAVAKNVTAATYAYRASKM
ncbi:hypothetical protein PBI_CAMILLE_32 [Microbacterium phage Camille]|nr:hypothetical protein PBI_CAMILLE_32 [Microbacterium phage Camille]